MRRFAPGLVFLATLAVLAACDEEFVPIAPDGPPYSMWGNLDPTSDRQVVRVVPITGRIDAEPDFSGITLHSVNRDTGDEQVWRDSVATYEDGTQGLLFVSDFRPAHRDEYEVQVNGPNDKKSYARATVPPAVTMTFDPSPNSNTAGDLLFPDAPRLYGPQTRYELFFLEGDPVEEPPRFQRCDEIVLTFDEQDRAQPIEFGWKVPVELRSGLEEIEARLQLLYGIPINLNDPNSPERHPRYGVRDVRFRTYVADKSWAPPFPFLFDPELLVEPGTLSNVRNGFGFVGSSYRVDWSWPPETLNQLPVPTGGC